MNVQEMIRFLYTIITINSLLIIFVIALIYRLINNTSKHDTSIYEIKGELSKVLEILEIAERNRSDILKLLREVDAIKKKNEKMEERLNTIYFDVEYRNMLSRGGRRQ